MNDPRGQLLRMLQGAIDYALPDRRMASFLPPLPKGRTFVVGAGKASAAMARAFEDAWPGAISGGIVVTRHGYALPCRTVEVVEAGHPFPDARGCAAAERILAMLSGLNADDLVVCLISGGGSALLPLPFPGISLEDKQELTRGLLRSGASISEINLVRRHLSAIKGGRLAAACFPARVVTLAISDVPGDNPVDIASGPTVPDPTTSAEALGVLERYCLGPRGHIAELLHSGASETVKPDDKRMKGVEFQLIATPQGALEAAAHEATAMGIPAHILSDRIEGEAREAGKALAGIALHIATRSQPFQPPCVLLSGGETTVTLRGNGRGGPNAEFLLSLGLALHGHSAVHALAADTDGVDGVEEIAGAVISPDSLERARALGIDPLSHLEENDSHRFFSALGDSIRTGPTYTNVNDFRAIMIL